MRAEKLSGITIVSACSPNRYISDAFVFSIRASVAAISSAFSSFDLKDGELLYIPSWNCCPLSDEANWAAVPHDESIKAAAMSSIELFFMFKSPIFYNNFVSSQLDMLGNLHAVIQSLLTHGRKSSLVKTQ